MWCAKAVAVYAVTSVSRTMHLPSGRRHFPSFCRWARCTISWQGAAPRRSTFQHSPVAVHRTMSHSRPPREPREAKGEHEPTWDRPGPGVRRHHPTCRERWARIATGSEGVHRWATRRWNAQLAMIQAEATAGLSSAYTKTLIRRSHDPRCPGYTMRRSPAQ